MIFKKLFLLKILFATSLLLSVFACNPDNNITGGDINDMPGNSWTGGNVQDNGNDRYDFDFYIGFDVFGEPYYDSYSGICYYNIFMGFSVPSGLKTNGIREFGIEVKISSGRITNPEGYEDGVYIEKNGTWTYFYGTIMSDKEQDWSPLICIESPSDHITLTYRAKFFDGMTETYITSQWEKATSFQVD